MARGSVAAIARRKAIYEQLHPETKHGGNAGGPSGKFCHTDNASFVGATSDATGKAERTVRLAQTRGEALGDDDLDAIAGTSLDKGVELDGLARGLAGQQSKFKGARISFRRPARRSLQTLGWSHP